MSEPVRPDPDAAEDYAEAVGVDPTQEEIDQYRRLEGEPPAAEPAVPDSAVPDSAVPDSAVPDSAVPDSAVPDPSLS